MREFFLKTALLLLGCLLLQTVYSQEIRSGLLLVSKKNEERTRFIPINKKVKIWEKNSDKVHKVKIVAVDSTFAYLSSGTRVAFSNIKRIRRKRIMFGDVGKATAVSGVATGKALAEVAWDSTDPYEYDSYTNTYKEREDSWTIGQGLVGVVGSVFVGIGVGIVTGVATATAGVVVGSFEPRYSTEKWTISAHNPETDIMLIHDIQMQEMGQ